MQGSVGVALLLVIAIYFGAALFRKRFLNFFFDQFKTVSERQAAAFAREQQRETGGYVQRLGQLVGLARDWALLRGAGLPVPPLPRLRWRRGAGAAGGEGSPASAPDGVPMPAPAPESAAGEGVRSESSRGPTLVFVSLGGESEEGGGFGGRPAGARSGAVRGPVVDLGPDGYTVLAGDLAPATVEDSRPEGAAPAGLAGEGEPRAVRPAAGDAENAVPRRLAAGVVDPSPDQYTVLAGGSAPERAAGPAGERFAPPPDGVPPGFGGEARSRGAHRSGAKGEAGAGRAAAAGLPLPTQGAPVAFGDGHARRQAADARRLSPGPIPQGFSASAGWGAAEPPDGAPTPQPGGREAPARLPEPAADAASAKRPPQAAGGADPAAKDAAARGDAGSVHAKSTRKAVQDGAAAGAMRPRAHVPPRLAAGVPQESVRPEGSGSEES